MFVEIVVAGLVAFVPTAADEMTMLLPKADDHKAWVGYLASNVEGGVCPEGATPMDNGEYALCWHSIEGSLVTIEGTQGGAVDEPCEEPGKLPSDEVEVRDFCWVPSIRLAEPRVAGLSPGALDLAGDLIRGKVELEYSAREACHHPGYMGPGGKRYIAAYRFVSSVEPKITLEQSPADLVWFSLAATGPVYLSLKNASGDILLRVRLLGDQIYLALDHSPPGGGGGEGHFKHFYGLTTETAGGGPLHVPSPSASKVHIADLEEFYCWSPFIRTCSATDAASQGLLEAVDGEEGFWSLDYIPIASPNSTSACGPPLCPMMRLEE